MLARTATSRGRRRVRAPRTRQWRGAATDVVANHVATRLEHGAVSDLGDLTFGPGLQHRVLRGDVRELRLPEVVGQKREEPLPTRVQVSGSPGVAPVTVTCSTPGCTVQPAGAGRRSAATVAVPAVDATSVSSASATATGALLPLRRMRVSLSVVSVANIPSR